MDFGILALVGFCVYYPRLMNHLELKGIALVFSLVFALSGGLFLSK
jgi:hypothetical protein